MIKFNCRYFRGARPCFFNKADGSECPSCRHFDGYVERILFIKLDAIGDVLRSASLLPAISSRHTKPYIAWLTRKESADLVAMVKQVDEVIVLSDEGLVRIMTGDWDQVYSISNDIPSASIATLAARQGPKPVGFYINDGVLTASNRAAEDWLEMAAFDRLKKENRRSYQELMMRIIDATTQQIFGPALNLSGTLRQMASARLTELFGDSGRQRVAINIGAGARWLKKMLDIDQIFNFIRLLRGRADLDVALVGGVTEVQKASAILSMCSPSEHVRAALTEASLPEFVALLSQVDVLVCGDTLALHIATALGLPTVAVFGPTSSAEIFDFGGLITKVWTPALDCLVCYGDCQKKDNCMSLLDLSQLVDYTVAHLKL